LRAAGTATAVVGADLEAAAPDPANGAGPDAAEAGRQGYVHLYTGDGKGKTTAALGLALRAAGHGLNVYVGQFMKRCPYGEHEELKGHPRITIEQFGSEGCIRRHEATGEHVELARHGLAISRGVLSPGAFDVVVLDEIDVAIWFGLITTDEVLEIVDSRPVHVELVLTGRQAPAALVERADLVTEMREVKHYYREGVLARPGIEY
jgi:cob(I)alamin adenosyltransferase